MRASEKFVELANPKNSILLFRIIGIDLLITVMLKFMQPRDILRHTFFSPSVNKRSLDQDRVEMIVRYADFLIRRNIPVLEGACLKRSLILYRFLRKEGLSVVINIGVAKENGNLVGHSWLTLNGRPYFETQERVERFNVVLNYP